MKKILFALVFVTSASGFNASADEKSDRKIRELEKKIETLEEKVGKMESTLMKGGGFMIVANYTCEIATPFDGTYTATELSETAARQSVVAECKKKANDKGQCQELFVKCKN